MTAAELLCRDSVGLPRFSVQQAKAMVDKVRKEGLLVSEPPKSEGRGIVIAGGGKYLSWAWVLCRHLRKIGCPLPIQVWHLGPAEMPIWAIPLFERLEAETVDAYQVMKTHPVREMSGWILKAYATMHCPWRHVMFLDADCFPVLNPEEIFNDQTVRKVGTLFMADVKPCRSGNWGYVYCGLVPPEKEWETGQYVVDKETAWMGLRWTGWMQEHTDVFYKIGGHGDKFVFELGFRVANVPYLFGDTPEWAGWGIRHRYNGREFWNHAMAAKRGEASLPMGLDQFFFEWETVRRR